MFTLWINPFNYLVFSGTRVTRTRNHKYIWDTSTGEIILWMGQFNTIRMNIDNDNRFIYDRRDFKKN